MACWWQPTDICDLWCGPPFLSAFFPPCWLNDRNRKFMCCFWAESGKGKPRMTLLINSKAVLEYGTQDSCCAKAMAIWNLWAVEVSLHSSVGTETWVPRTSPGNIYIGARICLFTAAFVTVSKVYISILSGERLLWYWKGGNWMGMCGDVF